MTSATEYKQYRVGSEVVELPSSMSDQEVYDAVSKLEGFDGTMEELGGVKTTAPSFDDQEYSWLEENLDFPAGIAGSIMGAKLGAPFGPLGAATGAVVGGGIGTFGGSLMSDVATKKELDYTKATTDSLLGMGIDIATLKLGKFIPDDVFMRTMQRLGMSPEQTAQRIVAQAGSPESLRQTQEMLTAGGATLTPTQTTKAGLWGRVTERLGNLGIGSQFVMRDNAEKVNKVIQEEFDKAFNLNTAMDASHAGQQLTDIITTGKEALSDLYVKGLDEVAMDMPRTQVSINPLRIKLSKIIEEGQIVGTKVDPETGEVFKGAIGSEYSGATRSFLAEQLRGFENVLSIDGKALIALEKNITKKQRELSTIGSPLYNPQAAGELLQVQGQLKGVYGQMLGRINPKVASKYAEVKQGYADGMTGLLPKINEQTVKRASEKGNFEGLGKVVLNNGTTDQIGALLSSVDKAYALAAKNNTLDLMQFKSAKEAKEALRTAFVAQNFPHILEEGLDPTSFVKKIRSLNTPTNTAKLQKLFGEQYPQLRKLMNAIEEVSVKPSGDMGQLMLRSQEYGAIKSLGQVITGGSLAAITMGLQTGGVAAAVLMTPYMFAKIATNPKYANKLLALTKGKFKDLKERTVFAALLANDVIKEMNPVERTALGEYLQTSAAIQEGASRQPQEQKGAIPQGALGGF